MLRELLPPPLQELFYRMSPPLQRHALNVCSTLQDWGCSDADLLAAALLHDVGKGGITLGERVALVLLRALAPGLLPRVAQPNGPFWQRRLWAYWRHAQRGAELAAQAGANPQTVRLIARHEVSPATDEQLRLLQRADSLN